MSSDLTTPILCTSGGECHLTPLPIINPGHVILPHQPCWPLTPELIRQHFAAHYHSAVKEKMVNAIMEVVAIDPAIYEYIHTVLNNLTGFQIELLTTREIAGFLAMVKPDFKTAENAHGYYCSERRTMALAADIHDWQLYPKIAHEFRHAMMHAMQIAHGNPNSMRCYCPATNFAREKVDYYLQLGDARVETLGRELKAGGKQRHQHLRHLCQQIYDEEYVGVPVRSTNGFDSKAEARQAIGRVAELGGHVVKIIGYEQKSPGNYVPVCKIYDCLESMVFAVDAIAKYVRENYPPNDYFDERDAYLYEHVPVPLIKHFYPELFNYTSRLISETIYPMDAAAINSQIETMMRAPSFHPETVEQILPHVELFINRGMNLDMCSIFLGKIINQGHRVGEANKFLGDINYKQKNYRNACQYYKRADKQGTLDMRGMLNYADALLKSEEYEAAKKWCNRAFSQSDTVMGSLRPQFEKIYAEAQSRIRGIRSRL